jgi:hypothetical protein
MDVMIKQEIFPNNLFSLSDETFENHHGMPGALHIEVILILINYAAQILTGKGKTN